MRYTDLFEANHTPQIDPTAFNGATTGKKIAEFMRKESHQNDHHMLWHVLEEHNEPGTYLALCVNPDTLEAHQFIVYTTREHLGQGHSTGWDWEECASGAFYDNLEAAGAYSMADMLEAAGVKVMGESRLDGAQGKMLDEWGGADRGWPILPATMALYGKRVVDIITAVSTWMPGTETILVCSKEDNGKRRILFVASSGDASAQYQKGQTFHAIHDQTRSSKGMYRIENVVVITDNEVVKKLNDIGLNGAKASLSVFK